MRPRIFKHKAQHLLQALKASEPQIRITANIAHRKCKSTPNQPANNVINIFRRISQRRRQRPHHRQAQNKHPTHAYRGRHTQQPHHPKPAPIPPLHLPAPNPIQTIHHQQHQHKKQRVLGVVMRLSKHPWPQPHHQYRQHRPPSQS